MPSSLTLPTNCRPRDTGPPGNRRCGGPRSPGVDVTPDLPVPPAITQRAWRDRSNSLAYLPGKSADQVNTLREVVAQLPVPAHGTVSLSSAAGAKVELPADAIFAAQLSGSGLAYRGESGWTAPIEVMHWATSGDDDYLTHYIHANVKFFGEMLQSIDETTRTNDLLNTASDYGLAWRSPDQIHRRIGWMRSLGLLERWGASRLVVTDRGRAFLAAVPLCSPAEATQGGLAITDESVELPGVDPEIATSLATLTATTLTQRKAIIGYVPRGRKAAARSQGDTGTAPLEAMRRFVDLLGEGSSADEFLHKAIDQLGQKMSSFTQSLHTFRNMQLIDMVAFGRYAPTPQAIVLLQVGNEVNLVRHFHIRYRFIGEILPQLSQVRTVSELASIAKTRYGCPQIDNSEVRLRDCCVTG